MTDSLARLRAAGVSVWLDDLRRERLTSGSLAALVRDKHVSGVTTNPTIFARSIAGSGAYSDQIRDLRKRGHVVGSHSCSHPERMSHYSWAQLIEEWAKSVKILSDILGEQVSTASVPGGYYSRKVAETASAAGIKTLFNSEPVTTCQYVDGCLVLGRYTVYRGMPASDAAAMATGQKAPRLKQLLFWKVKGLGKRVGGESYLKIRKQIVMHAQPNQPHMDSQGVSASR